MLLIFVVRRILYHEPNITIPDFGHGLGRIRLWNDRLGNAHIPSPRDHYIISAPAVRVYDGGWINAATNIPYRVAFEQSDTISV